MPNTVPGVRCVVPRVSPIQSRDQVKPEDQAVFDTVAAVRGTVRGPSSIVLNSPALAAEHVHLSRFFMSGTQVQQRELELAVCATAREKDCRYVWAAHVAGARKVGIGEATIAAVRDRGPVAGLDATEAAVITYVRQLLRENRVEQGVFDQLQKQFGAAWLVELTALVGHYGYLAGILNAFELLPAADAEQLPV